MDLDAFGQPPPKTFSDKLKDYFIEFFQTVVVIGAIFALIYLFVARFHKVSGNSMVPTFRSGDFLITEKVTYRFGTPKTGDIVILKNPRDESQEFIKRIIALPGDTIRIERSFVFVNEQQLSEPYLPPDIPTPAGAYLSEGSTIKVGANQYFVMGDNRSHSSDSRDWGGVSKQEIIGRALFRYWPPQAIGLLTSN